MQNHRLQRRLCVALVLAPLIGAVVASAAGPRVNAAAPVRPFAWIADRDADLLVAVDETLVPIATVAAPCPVRVRARRDGTAWCVLPRTCGVTGRHDLARARVSGALGRVLALAPVRDLECLDGEDALALEGDWSDLATRLLRVDEHGAARQIATWPGGTAVAGTARRVLLGTDGGEVVLFDSDATNGPPLARAALGGEVGDIAPAPEGGWWVLDVTGGSTLWRLDRDLRVLWHRALGGTVLDLAGDAQRELAWLPRASDPWVLAVGEGGRTTHDLDLSAFGDLDRGDVLPDGGCLLAAAAFVLRLAPGGSATLTQGGFDRILDLSLTPP
jgi:hypothetical protein